jgi:hypothetical protein
MSFRNLFVHLRRSHKLHFVPVGASLIKLKIMFAPHKQYFINKYCYIHVYKTVRCWYPDLDKLYSFINQYIYNINYKIFLD